MREELLHYLWKHKRLGTNEFVSTAGGNIQVLEFGTQNNDSGPDFFNAKIRIDNTVWAGNVEMHTKSSEWTKHGHQNDNAYDTVILHIVLQDDAPVIRKDGSVLPCIEIADIIPSRIISGYQSLLRSKSWIPCENQISSIDEFHISNFLQRLTIHRLERKSNHVVRLLDLTNYDWEEALYILLARSFGFKVNAEPMEQLARSLPLSIINKHASDLHQIEALLLGQSGLLDGTFEEEYPQLLQREYKHLKAKFSLISMSASAFKFGKLRPMNFPTIRLAQFANLLHQHSGLFSMILESDFAQLKSLFKIDVSDYWQTHYVMGKGSAKRPKSVGNSSAQIILINTIAPFLFIYAKHRGKDDLSVRAIKLLEQIPAEKNAITKKWNERGIAAKSAFDSQGLLELKNEWCAHKRCLQCNVGVRLLGR